MHSNFIVWFTRVLINRNNASYDFVSLLFCSDVWASLCLLQSRMFYRAPSFDQDIGGWDVSKGTDFVSVKKDTNMSSHELQEFLSIVIFSSDIIHYLLFYSWFWTSSFPILYLGWCIPIAVINVSWSIIIQSRYW